MQGRKPPGPKGRSNAQFDQFDASELFCPKCQRAMPVRKRLLLVLPEGDKYLYHCARCGTVCGDKIDRAPAKQIRLIV
jgi:uncharacterized Zn finger protein